MHEGEIPLADATAASLIAAEFPQWAHAPVRRIHSAGTVNTIFRIGESYAARFPLRGSDADSTWRLLEAEAAAAAEFAAVSPFPAPVPIALGRPGHGYPLPWSVQTWLEGTVASHRDPGASDAFAVDLARLVAALRSADAGGRTFIGGGRGGNRGGDLRDHDGWVEECLDRSNGILDVPALAALWERFRDLPPRGPDVMAHGDLIPTNVLVAHGRLVGVLDTGGYAVADRALDLIAGWHLLDDGPRSIFRREVACDDVEWERGKAWAFEQALGAVWYYEHTNPAMHRMGRRTLARIVAATPL